MFFVDTKLDKGAYGIGLFSVTTLRKGDLVYRTDPSTTIKLPSAIFESTSPSTEQFRKYAYKMNGEYYLCIDDGRFFNHSDSPNVVFDEQKDAYIAACDIQEGTELFCDYCSFCDHDDHNLGIIK